MTIKKKAEQVKETIEKVTHNVIKTSFPIVAPVITYNFSDLLRYFKYYMGSGLIDATVERRVQRELANRKDFPTKLFFGAIGIGIMIFMIMIGAVVLMSAAPSMQTAAPAAIQTIGG